MNLKDLSFKKRKKKTFSPKGIRTQFLLALKHFFTTWAAISYPYNRGPFLVGDNYLPKQLDSSIISDQPKMKPQENNSEARLFFRCVMNILSPRSRLERRNDLGWCEVKWLPKLIIWKLVAQLCHLLALLKASAHSDSLSRGILTFG